MVGTAIYQITAVSGSTNITTFGQPVTLNFHYLDSQIPTGVTESSLQIHYFDATSNSWVAITSTVDTVNNNVTATITHLTKFAILGKKTTTVTTTGITAAQLQSEIARITALIAQLQQQLAGISGTTTVTAITGVPATFTFQTNLKLNMVSEDVRYLQRVLNSDPSTRLASSGVGSSGQETNIFGPLTQAAVVKFQEKYASEILTPLGLTSGTGIVASATRAKLNQILGE